MAQVARGVLASHTTLMNTRWDEVAHLDEAVAFKQALLEARRSLIAADVDVAVVIGPNHFRGLWLDLMPAITVGVGEVLGAGEHGTPSGPQPTDASLARHLLDGLIDAGFDPAFSARLQVDHGITHAIQYVIPDGVPVVPVVVNSFAPPLPPLDRCRELGSALGAAVSSFARPRNVAVIASGGLSHCLPFPDWRSPKSDDDEFLVESWLNGRSHWEDYEQRRRQIVVSAPPILNEAFDKQILAAFADGDLDAVVAHRDDLVDEAGNGANEIRNWIIAAAACGEAPARTMCYSAMPAWLTGMGVAMIDEPVPPPAVSNPAKKVGSP